MINEYVENILAIFKDATQDEIAHGLNWYPDAKSQSHDIADETELPLHIVVGVVAAYGSDHGTTFFKGTGGEQCCQNQKLYSVIVILCQTKRTI